MRIKILPIFLFLFCLCCRKVQATEPNFQSLYDNMQQLQRAVEGLKMTVESQNEVIKNQSIKIDALEKGGSVPGGVAVPAPQGAPKIVGLSQGFNPEIGVVGTVQAHLTEDNADEEGKDTIALKELELGIAQYVDPYSRLDAIITFNDNLEPQNVDIEEAYYSHWGLPFGFRAQIGKFRSKIGKQNLKHLHALENADYPEVIKDFFGDEGLAASGIRLVNDIPNPWDIPLELTGEVLRGNNGRSFSGRSRRPIFNTHAKTFFEMSKDANLELGWTTLFGDENSDGQSDYGVKVYGADATFNWLLSEGRSVKFQNEIYFQRRGELVHVNDDPWGFYSLLDFRFSPKFSAGLRFDYVEPLDVKHAHVQTTAVSPYFTFWQSEFANFKIQYTHRDPAAGEDAKSDDAIFLTANFLIGAHKHPVQ